MVGLVTPQDGQMDEQVGLLSSENEDGGEWIDFGQYSEVVEPVLWCMLNEMTVSFDPTIRTDQAMELSQPGLRIVKIDGSWTCAVNWKREWEDGLPPYHIGVLYKDDDVAMLSPLLEARTCPYCKVGGWHTISVEQQMRSGTWDANNPGPRRVPRCVPGEWFILNNRPIESCIGYAKSVVDGKVLQWHECGGLDWYAEEKGLQVSRFDLQSAAAELAADNDGADDNLHEAMAPQ